MERNPLRLKVDSAKAGYLNDYHFARSAVTPYRTVSYTATQRYYMTDTATGETDVVLRGPLSIVRAIGPRFGDGSWQSLEKEGFQNWRLLP